MPPSIPEVQILEELGAGAHSVVYRGRHREREVAVKVLRNHAKPSEDDLVRFRREAAVLACLHHPSLPEVLAAGDVNGSPFLVVDYIEGETLSQALARGALPVSEVVRVGIALACALAEVHARGLVHCDIKPENVVLPLNGPARLIDFGLAGRVDTISGAVVGTLNYSAPERSGMLRRPVDGRSDLYSLGVLLFEAATGRRPFVASTAAEVAHLHATALPPDPRTLRESIPEPLARTILKLLAKDPDDRFQTASVLVAALERLGAHGAASPSKPPRRDSAPDLVAARQRDEFVGRDRELGELLAAMHSLGQSPGRMVVISGEAGAGKSQLTRQALDARRKPGGLVLVARCLEGHATPFAPLRDALERALSGTPTHGADSAPDIAQVLAANAADLAPFLVRFSPVFQALFAGAQQLSQPQALTEQFHDALATCFVRIAGGTSGAILCLEDAQWADHGTRQVLRHLAAHIRSSSLLVVCTFRSEPESDPSVEQFLAELAPSEPLHLALSGLSPAQVERLVRQELGRRPVDPRVLDRLVERSRGNPFAVREYVRGMLEMGVLRPWWDRWVLDADVEVLPLTQSILDLILGRLSDFDLRDRELLRFAALIGSRVSAGFLAAVCAVDSGRVLAAVDRATQSQLVESVGDEHFAFVHDRIREALLADIAEADRRRLHQRVADTLVRQSRNDPEMVFELARHSALGEADQYPARVFDANLAAGLLAAEQFALEDAFDYLERARGAAEGAGFGPGFALESALGEVCSRTGRLERAITHLERAVSLCDHPNGRALLRLRLARTHLTAYANVLAWQEVTRAYRELAAQTPRKTVGSLLHSVWLLLAGILFFWVSRSASRRERDSTLLEVHSTAGLVAYFANDNAVMLQVGLRALGLVPHLPAGLTKVRILSSFAFFLALSGLHRASNRVFASAQSVADQVADPQSAALAAMFSAYVQLMQGHVRRAEEETRTCIRDHGRYLDIEDYVNGCGTLTWHLMLRGYYQDALEWNTRAYESIDPRLRDPAALRAPLCAALGSAAEGTQHLQRAETMASERPVYIRIGLLGNKLLFLLEQDELGDVADQTVASFASLGFSARALELHQRHFYVAQGHLWYRRTAKSTGEARVASAARLAAAVRQLGHAAGSNPVLRAHHSFLHVALDWLQQRADLPLSRFEEATQAADLADSPWVLFESLVLRARVCADRQDAQAAARHARCAEAVAVQHGWWRRASWTRSQFALPTVALAATNTGTQGLSSSVSSSSSSTLRTERQLEALSRLGAASVGTLDLETQARIVLDELVRTLGAQRALLFLSHDRTGELVLKAGRDAAQRDLAHLEDFSRTVVRQVQATGSPLVTTSTDDALISGAESVVAHQLRSIVAAPLRTRDRLVGVVYLDNRMARGVFTQDDLWFLHALSSHIAVALETARAAELELRLRAQQKQHALAESLRSVAAAVTATLDLPTVSRRALEGLATVVPVHRGALLLGARGEFTVEASIGYEQQELPRLLERLNSSPALSFPSSPPPGVPPDRPADGVLVAGGTGSGEMLIALSFRGRTSGIVQLERVPDHLFSNLEVEVATTFTTQVAIALDNARLFAQVERQAITDELTGLHNRRHFQEAAEREVQRAHRAGHPLSLAVLDLDHFKQINDSYGHMVGDQVLADVASRFSQVLRTTDFLARYGGEEFVVLLTDTQADAATEKVLHRLRTTVESVPVATSAGPVHVTVSIGVAGLQANMSLEELVTRADTALYQAKIGGRNRVVCYHMPTA